MNLPRIHSLILATALWLTASFSSRAQTTADVVVYGSTPGGFCAAIAAAREGASVILLEPTDHVGGMNTGGLCFSDSDQMYREQLMGLFHEWHLRIQQDYEGRGITLPYDVNVKNQATWSYEAHVARRVTDAMLAEAGVTVLTERPLQSVNKTGPRITALVTSNGTYQGRVFIDGSYEGDLMAAAGVSWRIDRESRAEYGESYAGRQYPKSLMDIDGFDDEGDPLPLITAVDRGPDAIGDDELMVYSYRIPMTKNAANKVPMPEPDNYDPERFELIRRYVRRHGEGRVNFSYLPVPNDKIDANNAIGSQFSIGLVGGAKDWAEADQAGRAAILEAHKQYALEFIHFMKTDPVFSQAKRNDIAGWGLCADEFAEYGHFPPQLYVRASRRMRGSYVMTQADILDDIVKPDPLMVASFPIDSHDCRRVAITGGGVINEGTIFPVRQSSRIGYPHHVPYRAILPQATECDNLLVPVALSCTHVAISSLRIEATWMLIGQSAGIAGAMAADRDLTVQDLPYADLKPRLEAQGQVLTLPAQFQPLEGIVLDDPDAGLTGDWNNSTTISPYVGGGYRFAGTADTANDGSAVATFRFTAPEAGTYTLKMAYSPDPSRATNVPVTVTSGPNVTSFSVDQTVARPPGAVMREIGTVVLVSEEETVITVGTAGTTGFVILDAIQLVLDNSGASLDWSSPGGSAITENSAQISATLIGTEAEVTLFWKEGLDAPEEQTGWDGSINTPGGNVSPGSVERTITGLEPDTRYSCIYYASNGTIPAEAWSAPLTFATALTSAQIPVITGAVAGEGTITLTWQDNALTETGYLLQRAAAPGGPYTTIATLAADTTSYQDSSLPSSGTYFYRLAATNADNGSTTDLTAAQTDTTVVVSTPTSFQEGVTPTSAYTHDAVYIRSGTPDANFNDDPDRELIVGTTATPDVLRILLAFDLSALATTSEPSSVALSLTTHSATGLDEGGEAGDPTFDLHAYGAEIDESNATWNGPGSGDLNAGGTLGVRLSSARFDPTQTNQKIEFADTPEFRSAVSEALAGDGILRLIIVKSDESTLGTHEFARFHDESAITLANRPELQVTAGSPRVIISAFSHLPGSDEIILGWQSSPGESYRIVWSLDLEDWNNPLATGVPSATGDTTTGSFDLIPSGIAAEPRVFFRVERE